MNRPPEPTAQAALAGDAYARRIAERLSQASSELPYEITERLRAARMQALDRRRRAVAVLAQPAQGSVLISPAAGNAALLGGKGGDGHSAWWRGLASAVPLLALLAGLVFINASQDESLATEMAEVDAALLADDLPPSAYADPGFVQYLRVSGPSR